MANESSIIRRLAFTCSQHEEAQEYSRLLWAQVQCEKRLETDRQDLVSRREFSLEQVFEYFDTKGRGFFNRQQMIAGFNKFQVFPSPD